jgi:hypothetical protein
MESGMDGERFDAIARLAGTGRSRRALVRAALGSVFAGALAGLGTGDAAAECREAGRNCGANADCCTRICRRGVCRPCPAGERCSGGRCCPTGFVACPGNPVGCIPADTACSGRPVCCDNDGQGPGIVCGTLEGQCQAGSAPPPATCPAG